MSSPLISVVITTYNQEKFIGETLESVISQDYDNFEIIVSDDCSNDKTYNIIEEYKKMDKRIKCIRNLYNMGPSKNVNNALRLTTGEYISFLAGDDLFLPRRLSILYDIFKNNKNLKIVYSDGIAFGKDVNEFSINKHLKVYDILDMPPKRILHYLYTNVSPLFLQGVLIRSDFVKKIGFFDESTLADDYVFNIRIFQNIKAKDEYTYTKEVTWKYRIHDNNLHKNTNRQKKLILQVVKKYTPFYLKPIAYYNIYKYHFHHPVFSRNYFLNKIKEKYYKGKSIGKKYLRFCLSKLVRIFKNIV